jgi:hypothetical protein
VPGQVAEVGDFGAGESAGAQGLLVGGEEFRRRGRPVVEERSKASVDGAGGCRRELLANDGADKGAVSVVWASTAPLLDAERTYSFHK